MNVLWTICGAGHRLRESVAGLEEAGKSHELTVCVSSAGWEVAIAYGLADRIRLAAHDLILESEQGASSPICARVSAGHFDVVVIAPATSNTVAKLRYGIADSMVSNVASQALKSRIDVKILPSDQKPVERTEWPSSKKVDVYCRKVDLENTKALASQGGITLLGAISNLIL